MFGRIANLFKGFISLFISGVERRNPEALLELEQENLRKQIGQFNQGLASHAGLSQRLMSQVRKLEAEQKDLRAKTTAHVRAGNNAAAGQYALRLQSVEAQLEENRKQLEQAEATYKNLVKARDVAVQTARAKVESLKGAINDMRMNQAMAELHEMSAGMITGGYISESDNPGSGAYYELRDFYAQAGQQVTVTYRSSEFDAYLEVGQWTGGGFMSQWSDDDSGGGETGFDSQITFRAPYTGLYTAKLTTYSPGETGLFSFEVQAW